MTIDELIARAEIHDVLMTYCRAVDRGDIDLLRSVYHPGALDRHGSFDGTGEEFAPYIVEKMDAAELTGQHLITNISYLFDSPTHARVESYFLAFQPYQADTTTNRLGFIGGRYLDRFERRESGWRIADRLVLMDWSRAHLDGAAWPGMINYPTGARREADPLDAFIAPTDAAH